MENRRTQRPDDNERGFTLIELLVVMVILGLLAAVVVPNLFGNVDKARVQTARTQIETIGQALDHFRLDTGRYPTTTEGLNALNTNPGIQEWAGPYLKKLAIPNDPWGTPYQYQSPGTHGDYDLSSFGADKTPGGDGYAKDINSWE
jgi:general secretion pathway protein G